VTIKNGHVRKMYFYKDLEYLRDRKKEGIYGGKYEMIINDLCSDIKYIAQTNATQSGIKL